MELKINISEDCKNCRRGLKYLKSLQKQHKNWYAHMNMKTYEIIEGILLIPDFNASGFLTHFHIEKATKEKLKEVVEGMELQEKDSEKIKKFIRKKNENTSNRQKNKRRS